MAKDEEAEPTAMAISRPAPLSAGHDVSAFDCGKPSLNDWLKARALRNQEHGFTVVMVVHQAGRVIGYYGLAPSGIVSTAVPRSVRTGQAPAPFPVILLGQLAVDREWHGRGIGDGLLSHALVRCAAAAELIGGRAVVVNAIDAEAERYWRSRGFLPSRDDARTLFRSIPDIRRSLAAADHAPITTRD